MVQPSASASLGRITLGGRLSPRSHMVIVLELFKSSAAASFAWVMPFCR